MSLAVMMNQFNVEGRLVTLVPFGSGNINDTFLAVFRNTFTEIWVTTRARPPMAAWCNGVA